LTRRPVRRPVDERDATARLDSRQPSLIDPTALVETWNGTRWTIRKAPSPANSIATSLLGVSCSSATTCITVGFYEHQPITDITLAAAWNGSNWTIDHTPDPDSLYSGSYLSGVSCTSSAACTAVGASEATAVATLAERWNGTSWSVQSTPTSTPGALYGVSCTARRLYAVGETATGASLAEAWDSAGWNVQSTPIPAGSSAALLGVSCNSASACTAVGASSAGGASLSLAETES
jgi:hypothetical protein